MADTVRYLMEEMVPELEDLEVRGYFNRDELKQIVKRRTDFEYALKRRAALKQDFLRYAEYEMKLEDLRRMRRASRGIQGKKTLADFAIVRRVHFIYERATRKFRGDMTLWMQWLKFCRKCASNKQTSKTLTKALQLHPKVPGLWAYAAAWEFESNKNPQAARALMQQGLRVCQDSPLLWAEYFRFELLYAHKLRVRRKVLGLAGPEDAPLDASDETEAAARAVLEGAVAAVVLKNAFAALPASVELRRGLLGSLRLFDFSGTAALRETILSNLREMARSDEEAADLLAREVFQGTDLTGDQMGTLAESLAEFEDAYRALPSGVMAGKFSRFLVEVAQAAREAANASALALVDRHLESLFEDELGRVRRERDTVGAGSGAASGGASVAASSEAFVVRVSFLAAKGDGAGALRAAEAASGADPASGALWQTRLALHASQHGAGDATTRDAILQALDGPAGADPALWLCALRLAASGGHGIDFLRPHLVRRVALGTQLGGVPDFGPVVRAAVDVAVGHSGAEAGLALAQELLRLPKPGADLFRRVIALETARALAEDAPGRTAMDRVWRACDAALEHYGQQDAGLWASYHRLCAAHDPAKAGQVHWRAVKALDDPDDFAAFCAAQQ